MHSCPSAITGLLYPLPFLFYYRFGEKRAHHGSVLISVVITLRPGNATLLGIIWAIK